MAITTSVTAAASASWQQKDTDALNTNKFFDNQGSFAYAKNFVDGTGLKSVNAVYNQRVVLASGADTTINLQSLTTNLFGTSITTAFTGIKQVYVENTATGVGQDLYVLATGSNANSNIFNGSGNFIIYPMSVFQLTNYVSGWPITNTTNNIILRNAGVLPTTGNLFLAGTTG